MISSQLATLSTSPEMGLALIEAAQHALAEARSVDQVKDIRDQAEQLRLYLKAAKYGLAMQNDAAEIKIRAERKGGELLRQMPKNRGVILGGNVVLPPSDAPRLSEIGISKRQSADWQQIARLPEPVFEQHIVAARATGTQEITTAGVIEAVKQYQRIARADARTEAEAMRAALPIPVVPVRLEVADARSLPLADATVDLIVTSPPYGLGKDYGRSQRDPAEGWYEFMLDWLIEARRVTKFGGRLALNVPLDTTKPYPRPTYAEAVGAATLAGWQYRFSIVWNKGNGGSSLGRGSVDSPAAPHVVCGCELIAVFAHGEWGREVREADTDLTHAEWLAWTDGLWTFPGEGRAWNGHPAAFPVEIPRRLITLLSFRGDTVLDPFVGSGTTVVEAHRLGRMGQGFDLSEKFIADSRHRVAEGGHAAR